MRSAGTGIGAGNPGIGSGLRGTVTTSRRTWPMRPLRTIWQRRWKYGWLRTSVSVRKTRPWRCIVFVIARPSATESEMGFSRATSLPARAAATAMAACQ